MGLSTEVKKISTQNPMCVHRRGVVGELVNGNTVNLFTVQRNDVHVTGILGKITAAMDAGTADVQLRIIPRDGAVPAQQVLSLASGSLANLLANEYLEPTGALGAAITLTATYGAGVALMVTNDWILTPGIINILVGTATNTTGAIDWYIEYRPLAPDAEITPL